jgi:DNA polymerase-3 subunit delta'
MDWNILGHDWAVSLLKEHILQGRLRHAYLLTGPQGVGRRTLAIRLAQALNCPQPPAPAVPCLKCRVCSQIERMQHADLAVIQAETEGGILKVDQVRELHRSLSLAPYEARFRVAMLLRFEEANPSAANALLKTLEEPPAQVILLLTASSAEDLLPTIVSRCEVLRLRPLSMEQTRQGLEERWNLPPDQAGLLAHISGGRPGYALRLHNQAERMERRSEWLNDLPGILAGTRVERFAYAEKLAKDKERMREALQVWISFWRDVLVQAAGASAPVANLDFAGQVENAAARYGLEQARCAIAALERSLDLLERNANTRLVGEVLMLDLPR